MKNLIQIASLDLLNRVFTAKKGICTLCLNGFFLLCAQTAWSQANTVLSNLESPTKVNVTLQPSSDNSKNLGSDAKSWKDLYLDGYLYLDGERFISNPPGIANIFVGKQVGNTTLTGSYNIAFGDNALVSNTSGGSNTAFGHNTLESNTSGIYNSAFGNVALKDNTIGNFNSAFGWGALSFNNTGNDNSAFGYATLELNTTGISNAAFGVFALTDNTTGIYNSAFGKSALYQNTSGDYNSAYGSEALYDNSTGSENAAFGREALSNNTVGIQNVAVGNQAGIGNTTGDYGTFLGYDAGGSNTSGSQNTYLGYSTEASGSTYTNVVGVGYQVTNTASNQVRIGNSSTTSIGGYASWTNISDGRFKKNVKEEVAGLDFINKLRPVTYNLDLHAADAFIGKEFTGDHETDAAAKISEQAKSAKEKIIYSGFIAQEVEAAAKEIGYDFSGIDAPKNEKDMYGLRYAEFVVPLVKSVQELSKQNDELKSQLAYLQLQIDELQSGSGTSTVIRKEAFNSGTAHLSQIVPNPFSQKATISFTLPADVLTAQLSITDARGKVVDTYTVSKGSSEQVINAGKLSAGVYQYALIVNGKMIDSKQMVIVVE